MVIKRSLYTVMMLHGCAVCYDVISIPEMTTILGAQTDAGLITRFNHLSTYFRSVILHRHSISVAQAVILTGQQGF